MDKIRRLPKVLTDQEIKAKLVKPDMLYGRFKVGEIYDAYYIAPSIFSLDHLLMLPMWIVFVILIGMNFSNTLRLKVILMA